MRKFTGLIKNFPEIIGGLMMLAITLILFAGVVWRYFFVDPLSWTDEIARVMFAWLAFIGAAVGVKRRLHSTISVISHRVSPRWRQATTVFGLAVTAVMASVLFYTGAHETAANFNQAMPVTGLSRGWLYLAVPVSGLLMLVYLVPQMWAAAHGVAALPVHENID